MSVASRPKPSLVTHRRSTKRAQASPRRRITFRACRTRSPDSDVTIVVMPLNNPLDDGPELFVALAAATGTDLERVTGKLNEALKRVRYTPHVIRLASLLKELPEYAPHLAFHPDDQYIDTHMTQGNELRRKTKHNDAMAILGIGEIKKIRQEAGADESKPRGRHAYILRSLKHPEELCYPTKGLRLRLLPYRSVCTARRSPR